MKMSKTRSLNIFYDGRSSQPSMAQLQPVPDVSDPLKIVIGNPELKPSFNHTLRFRFQDFNSDAQRSIMAMAFGQYTQNSIVSSTVYDTSTGGQVTNYQNVNGVWNLHGFTMLSMPLRNKAFTFNNHLSLGYANAVGFSNGLRNRSGSLYFGESFGIAWRPENVEMELRPSYRLQYVTNSLSNIADRTTHTYGATFYGTYYTPIGIVLNTDVNYQATSGYSDGYDTSSWLWNASVSYQFLRDKAATVSLKAYDILGQRSNVRRNVTANYIDDSRYNSLTRYFMVTFAYKFNTFGKGQEPARRDEFRGPGGPGGPGGRPSGPPPGGGRPPRF